MCAQPRQLRVMALRVSDFAAVIRGEVRIRNFPSDAQIIAACPAEDARRVGLMVYPAGYTSVPRGTLVPVVAAVLEQAPEEMV